MRGRPPKGLHMGATPHHWPMSPSRFPEVGTLLEVGEINVGNQVEVWTCSETLVVITDKDSGGSSFATTDLTDGVTVIEFE